MMLRINGRDEAERIAAAVQVACMQHGVNEDWAIDLANRIRKTIRDCDERRYRRKLADLRRSR